MSARSIRKRLMRRRDRFRASLDVRIPLSAYPDQPPPFNAPGIPHHFDSHWIRREDDVDVVTAVGQLSGNYDPRTLEHADEPHFVEERRPGEWYWIEGVEIRIRVEDSTEVDRRPAPTELVSAWKARKDWLNRWSLGHDGAPEWVHALKEPECYAKTLYAEVVGEYMQLTYSVKWRYPDTMKRFCAALSRSLRECRRAGVRARVVQS